MVIAFQNPIGTRSGTDVPGATPSLPSKHLSKLSIAYDLSSRFLYTLSIPAKSWYIITFIALKTVSVDTMISRVPYWSMYWVFPVGMLSHFIAKKKIPQKYDGRWWIEFSNIMSLTSSIFTFLMKITALTTPNDRNGDTAHFTPIVFSLLISSVAMSLLLRKFSGSPDITAAISEWISEKQRTPGMRIPPYLKKAEEGQKILTQYRKPHIYGANLSGQKSSGTQFTKRVLAVVMYALASAAAGGMLNELLSVPVKRLGNATAHSIFYFGPLLAALYGGINYYFFENHGLGRTCKTEKNARGRAIFPGATIMMGCSFITNFTYVGLTLVMQYLSVPQLQNLNNQRVSETVAAGQVPLPKEVLYVVILIAVLVAARMSHLQKEWIKHGAVRRLSAASSARPSAITLLRRAAIDAQRRARVLSLK